MVGWSVGYGYEMWMEQGKKVQMHMHELKCFMQTAKVQKLDAALMVKQQLPVMYWFWCWLIQMPDADHMQRTERCSSGQFPLHPFQAARATIFGFALCLNSMRENKFGFLNMFLIIFRWN